MTRLHTLSQVCQICERALGRATHPYEVNNFRVCHICRKNGPPDEYRCQGLTNNGNRCKLWATVGGKVGDYCKIHEVKE